MTGQSAAATRDTSVEATVLVFSGTTRAMLYVLMDSLNVRLEILVANCLVDNGDAVLFQMQSVALTEKIAVHQDTLVMYQRALARKETLP